MSRHSSYDDLTDLCEKALRRMAWCVAGHLAECVSDSLDFSVRNFKRELHDDRLSKLVFTEGSDFEASCSSASFCNTNA